MRIAAPYKFTGKIAKVTVDLPEIRKAEKAAEDELRAAVAQKKAMAD